MYATKDEVFAEIEAAKLTYPELAPLNSTSTTALWRIWAKLTADIVFNFQTILQKFQTEIENTVKKNQTGSMNWYAEQALLFQYGVDLVYTNGVYGYASIDPAKQIIKRVAIASQILTFGSGKINSVTLKVASENTDGEAIPLTTEQKNAFDFYLSKIMFAGSYISSLSLPKDRLKITLEIYKNASNDSATIKAEVITKLTDYVQNLPFNGIIRRNDIILLLRNIVGVTDCDITFFQAKADGGVYADVDLSYNPISGYIDFDEAWNLETEITIL